MSKTSIYAIKNALKVGQSYDELKRINDSCSPQERETEWVCAYCGSSADGAPDPSQHHCCGEVGHVEEVYRDTGESVQAAPQKGEGE
jgi:hypothetical protein